MVASRSLAVGLGDDDRLLRHEFVWLGQFVVLVGQVGTVDGQSQSLAMGLFLWTALVRPPLCHFGPPECLSPCSDRDLAVRTILTRCRVHTSLLRSWISRK